MDQPTKQKQEPMVLVSNLPSVTYLASIRIKPGINRLTVKQLDLIRPIIAKNGGWQIVTETEAKSLLG